MKYFQKRLTVYFAINFLLLGTLGFMTGCGGNLSGGASGNTSGGKPGGKEKPAPAAALTFDDGPSITTTVEILDRLEMYDVPASFFVIGNNIKEDTIPIMRRAKELGCEFGNHSLTHQEMAAFNAEKIKEEINTTTQLIQNAVGNTPVFFRAPFASVSATMYSTIEMPFIRGVIANDWDENYDVNYRSDTILRQTVDGTIICMHDFEGNRMTVEALDTIIPSLKDKGFQLVTISQLFERKGVTPKTRSGYYDNV